MNYACLVALQCHCELPSWVAPAVASQCQNELPDWVALVDQLELLTAPWTPVHLLEWTARTPPPGVKRALLAESPAFLLLS